jgi:hypothetical protein
LSKQELAVIAKGLPAAKLRNIHDEAELATILRQSINTKITRCRRFLLRNESDKHAVLIFHFSDVRVAQQLCFTGVGVNHSSLD